MTSWIDTHCHLDAAEFGADARAVLLRAAAQQVGHCVIPAVVLAQFDAVRNLAHQLQCSYALGIHPLYVGQSQEQDLKRLDEQLQRYRDDPRLVAVGEIGLDYFVPELILSPLREQQDFFYREQLKLARLHGLPVILHVRRSADALLKGLREIRPGGSGWSGIAHAFNGSEQQAQAFIDLGFKLGFGGALTYERALNLRRLVRSVPLEALVLETDAPDMPPHGLYTPAAQRVAGQPQPANEPAQLPRIAAVVAELRGMALEDLASANRRNAIAALPKLAALLD